MIKTALISGTILLCLACTFSHALESGAFISVGTENGRGPLATDAIISDVVGTAHVYGSEMPDLFVRTGKFGHHPGLFLYPWSETTQRYETVFKSPIPIAYPFDAPYPPSGTIHQTKEGTVHAIWLSGNNLVHTRLDIDAKRFHEVKRLPLKGLPRTPSNLALIENPDGTVEVLLGISDGTPYKIWKGSSRDPKYQPYTGAGIWHGGHPYVGIWAVTLPKFLEGPASNPRRVSASDREVRMTFSHFAVVGLDEETPRSLITGSRFGGLHYFENVASQGIELKPKRHAVNSDGVAMRHPQINPGPVAYPGQLSGKMDLIAGGEGGVYYYQFQGLFSPGNKPLYELPRPVLQENAMLFGGSLPVPTGVDWDGDGAMDIVAGNSEGRVLFFKNAATNAAPAFLPGKQLLADNRPIHIQPGYRMDIQGPGEARWGYTCPTVADWNEDGLPDILMSDSTAQHRVYINRGTKTHPKLDAAHPIYFEGLELHGTWRVKPGVAKLGERMAYVALDEQDEFHLYWQVDSFNLEDGGKLCLDDGSAIGANFLSAGGTGRLKINLVDWDQDGLHDLLVGTPRHASVPNPETGLPQSLGLPGSAVLFLKNVGSNTAPVFKFPVLMQFKGKPIFLGQHACAPTVADFGGADGPDLIVGEEGGRFIYYSRADLSW